MDKFVKKLPSSSKKKSVEKAKRVIFPDFPTFIEGLGTWRKPLDSFVTSKNFGNTFQFVKERYESKLCFPPKDLIFNAFITTPIEDVKVVIVGQDPYIQPNQAMGLCFSVNKGVKVPPSLVNVYKSMKQDEDLEFTVPEHGDLTNWANQGVFLLNAVLTVDYDDSGSHKKSGWQKFSDHVIKTISKRCDGVVFLLWGGYAKKKKTLIDTTKHHVLESCHPSPLSAYHGFFECQHFSKANKILEDNGKGAIDWNKVNE